MDSIALAPDVSDEGEASFNLGRWKDLVTSIQELVATHDLANTVVFHGTSSRWQRAIEARGLRPTIVHHAYFKDGVSLYDPDMPSQGTFWGQVSTASWYSVDTVVERDGGTSKPILIAAVTSDLLRDFDLFPDRASLEGIVDNSVPVAQDMKLAQMWDEQGENLGWEQGLRDIGGIFAAHYDHIEPENLCVIECVDDFTRYLGSKGLIRQLSM